MLFFSWSSFLLHEVWIEVTTNLCFVQEISSFCLHSWCSLRIWFSPEISPSTLTFWNLERWTMVINYDSAHFVKSATVTLAMIWGSSLLWSIYYDSALSTICLLLCFFFFLWIQTMFFCVQFKAFYPSKIDYCFLAPMSNSYFRCFNSDGSIFSNSLNPTSLAS